MKQSTNQRRFRGLCQRALLCAAVLAFCGSSQGLTLYRDTFQSYPVQNPAPNPLTNGPAGGQWYYVDDNGVTTVNEHRIWDSTTVGAGLNSRVWVTLTNNARLTNAISLSQPPRRRHAHTETRLHGGR